MVLTLEVLVLHFVPSDADGHTEYANTLVKVKWHLLFSSNSIISHGLDLAALKFMDIQFVPQVG